MSDDLKSDLTQENLSEPCCHNRRVDESGCIRVENRTASWVPELILHREIGGTVYSVFGSYEGIDALDKKVLRIMSHNLKNMEESE